MGKRRIIAETGAGQHGIATAAACARLGMECVVYMGAVDVMRQQPNVAGMELYGAKVVPVYSGAQTLKDAINEAMRDWAANFQDTHYLIGSALGPAPFPHIVRTFQSVIGRELREQLTRRSIEAGTLVACVGGGSNAIGFFSSFLDDTSVRLIGAEAGGMGPSIGQHAVRMSSEDASEGIIHGYKSRFLVDSDGQVSATHSISAGLDYPGIGPQLAALGVSGRIEYTSASDIEALEAVRFFARNEGVLFALESAHAGAVAMRLARESSPDERPIVINMSGRGEKDLFITSPYFRREEWERFLASELHMVQKREEFK
jgi:tryptophan synthase beta chain